MSDNYFTRTYGAAPVAEEPVAPPPAAPAPAPSGNYFVDTYIAPAPQQPPSPSAALHADESYPAPTAQPAAAPQAAPQTVPQPGLGGTPPDPRPIQDRLTQSILPQAAADAGRFVEDVKAAPSVGDKLGTVAGLYNKGMEKVTARSEQRLSDEMQTGSRDTTLGGMGLPGGIAGVIAHPETLLDLPEAVGELAAHPENLADSMAMDIVESPGGLDQTKQSFEDWAKADPARFESLRAQGEGVPYQTWKDETERTLESGGIGGALSGLGADAGMDPFTPATMIAGGVADQLARGAMLAGKQGMASGILKTNRAAQIAADPTGELLIEPVLRGAVNKATKGLFSLTKEAQQERVVGGMDEVLTTATRGVRNDIPGAPAPVAQNAAPASAAPSTNGSVPPTTPLVVQNTPPIASQPVNGSAPPSPPPMAPPATAAAQPFVPAAPAPSKRTLNLNGGPVYGGNGVSDPFRAGPAVTRRLVGDPPTHMIDETGIGRKTSFTVRQIVNGAPQKGTRYDTLDEALRASGVGASRTTPTNGNAGAPFGGRPATSAPARPLTPLMRNGDLERGGRWVDPATGEAPSFAGTRNSLVGVKPEDVKGFAPGPHVLPTQESAFTQHLAAATEQGKLYNDRPATRTDGTPAQRQAGRNWTDLMRDRIKAHGAGEVERLIKEFQGQQADPYYKNMPSQGAYWKNRAEAIIEAATKADFDTSFTLRRGGKPFIYTPANGSSSAIPIREAEAMAPTPENILADPVAATNAHFATGGYDDATRRSVGSKLDAFMASPEAWGEKFKSFREQMYRNGAWSQAMDGSPASLRYDGVLSAWSNTFGSPPRGEVQFRRGTVGAYGALTPEERAVAEGLATEFRAHLDRMGLGNVHLSMVDAVFDTGTMTRQADLAAFDPEQNLIELAVDRTYQAVKAELGPYRAQSISPDELAGHVKRALHQSLNHEGFHALRNAGVITPDEWSLLTREARARKYGAWADETYGDLAPAGRDEEAVAEMFGDFANDAKVLSSATRTIFQKITDFFTGLIRAIDGTPSAESVMKKMLSGDVGARASDATSVGGTRMARRGKTALGNMDLSQITEEDPLAYGAPMAEGEKALALDPFTYKGKMMPALDVYRDVTRDMDRLAELAAKKAASPGARFADQKELTALSKQFSADNPNVDWATITPAEIDPIAMEHARLLWELSKYPAGTAPKKPGALSGPLGLVDDWTAANRKLRLAGLASAPQQSVRQILGNLATFLIDAPEGVVTMFKPKAYASVYKSLKTADGHSDYGNFILARDRAIPQRLDTRKKSMAGYETNINNPTIKKITDIFAPKRIADLVQVGDGVATEGLHFTHYVMPMKEELRAAPKMGAKVFKAYSGKYKSDFPAITDRQVQDVVAKAIKSRKFAGEPMSRATGDDIKADLIAAFENSPMAGMGDQKVAAKALRDFADRVGRNVNEADNLHFQNATRKVNKTFQSWENLNIDQALNHVLLFTYWASRTSGTYAKAMLRKPWMAASLMRLTEEVQQEAEAGNYPEWMKGYTRILNSPFGLTLFANWMDAVSTMFVMAEWQYGESWQEAMKGDLTALGSLRGVLPAVISAPIDYAMWLAGAYGGEDARMPYNITGLTPITRRVAQGLNLAGEAGLLPAGFGTDANGVFHPLNETPLEDVAAHIGAFLGRPVAEAHASEQIRQEQHLQQILIEEHPEWATDPGGADALNAAVLQMKNDAAAGTYSPEWLQSEQLMAGDSLNGPDFPGLPEPLRSLVGGTVRALSPIRIMSEPEIKSQLRAGDVPVGTNDEFDAGNVKNSVYDTLEIANLKAQNEDYWAIGTDTGMKDASRVYQSITNANFDGTISIYGKSYTKEALVDGVMTKSQRYDVANDYLASQGYTSSDLDAYYAAREEMEAAHPDLAAYHEFSSYTKDYEGGLPAFVGAAVLSSPSYARYMAQLPYPPGSPEYYGAGDSTDAFYALEGRRSGIYDPTTLPDKGTIPNQPPGMTFSMKRALEANADAAAASSSGGDGSSYDDFVGEVQGGVDDIYNSQQLLDAWFPGAGYQAGVTYFEKGTYDALKEAGYYVPKKGDIAYEYYDWLLGNATTTDPSVKAFLDQREKTGSGEPTAAKQENVSPEMILAQRGGNVDVVDTSVPRSDGAIDTSRMQRATPNLTIPGSGVIYSQPSLDQQTPLVVPPGRLVHVIEQHGDWAYVIAPGNQVGWMPTVALSRA